VGLITFFCLSGRGCIVEEAQNAAEELCAAEGTETCSILSLGIGKTPLKSLCAKLQGSVPQEAAKKEGGKRRVSQKRRRVVDLFRSVHLHWVTGVRLRERGCQRHGPGWSS
jgi:hypothetical protein